MTLTLHDPETPPPLVWKPYTDAELLDAAHWNARAAGNLVRLAELMIDEIERRREKWR